MILLTQKLQKMCFYIHSEYKKIKVADKDIPCWKIFTKSLPGFVNSLYEGFPYERGALYYENNMHKEKGFFYESDVIYIGLHSFSTLAKARVIYGISFTLTRNKIIIRCVIPKGSKYYYNPDRREYVSDHLLIGTRKVKL